MEKEYVFTDGSSLGNNKYKGRKAGYGVFFKDGDIRNLSQTLNNEKNLTNNIAELKACIEAIELSDKTKQIILVTDSMYCINCITNWYDNWKKNNWITSSGKPVSNKELIVTLYDLYKLYNVQFKHINSHMKKPNIDSEEYFFWYGNMMADMLAVNGANKIIK